MTDDVYVCKSQVEFAYRLTSSDLKKLKDIASFNQINYTVQRTDYISDLFPVHIFTSFDSWRPERMRLPSPLEVEIQCKEAKVHCTLLRTKVCADMHLPSVLKWISHYHVYPFISLLCFLMLSQQELSVPQRPSNIPRSPKLKSPKSPKKPLQSKPSRRSFRRRSSLPSLPVSMDITLDAVSRDMSSTSEIQKEVSSSSPRTPSRNTPNIERRETNEPKDDEERDTDVENDQGEVRAKCGRSPGDNILLYDRRPTLDTPALEVALEGLDDTPLIFRLRRMVPPGNHAYAFAVGLDFDKSAETDGANTVFDYYQPNSLTTLTLKQDDILCARLQGVSLPTTVNTINVFKSDFSASCSVSNVVSPPALSLSSKLAHRVAPKPRHRHMPTLDNRKKLWNRMESVLYKQWLNYQQKYVMECFHTDWRHSSIYTLLMSGTSDENERYHIMSVLKERYGLLKVMPRAAYSHIYTCLRGCLL